MIREQRRTIERRYFSSQPLYLLQVFERNFFKDWVTVAVTTDKAFARRWRLSPVA